MTTIGYVKLSGEEMNAIFDRMPANLSPDAKQRYFDDEIARIWLARQQTVKSPPGDSPPR